MNLQGKRIMVVDDGPSLTHGGMAFGAGYLAAKRYDPAEIVDQLTAIERVARGDASAGPIAALPKAERFHWLASPSSTMVQRSEVHAGLTSDPAATLDHLFRTLVVSPGAR